MRQAAAMSKNVQCLPSTDVRAGCFSTGTLAGGGCRATLAAGLRRWQMPIVIEITAGMLLAFFWAFWVFAFGGWWCGGGC